MGSQTNNITDEIPFEIPSNWFWCRLKHIGEIVGGGTPSTAVKEYWFNGSIVWITPKNMSKLKTNYIIDSDRKITLKGLQNSSTKLMPPDSIIMSSRAPIGYIAINKVPACTSQGCKSVVPYLSNMSEFLLYIIKSSINRIISASSGTTFDEISGTEFSNILIPLAPINEQIRIVKQIDETLKLLRNISEEYKSIQELVTVTKSKILDSFFSENSSYKSYYENEYLLDDLLPYEQPGPYIVKSTNYDDKYDIPVLTPGKSFILGYINEKEGIYRVNNSKAIIFDDFTTASRLIDFNFKVKSSAMKILKSSDESKFNIDYLYFLLQTLYVNNDTHKRYWISEFAIKKVKVHTFDDQIKIVKTINDITNKLDYIIDSKI